VGNQDKTLRLRVANFAHARTLTGIPKRGNVSAQDTDVIFARKHKPPVGCSG
jgi:hypothetical protein